MASKINFKPLFRRDDIFEVTNKDMLGRIGRLHTKSGTIETPALLPVVHPTDQIVSPREIGSMGFQAIMTNAYLTRRAFGRDVSKKIHDLLDFPGIVATDSGAYQILTYGKVDISQTEVIKFQERIESDIAVILDIPTGLTADRKHAESTVKETIVRADLAIRTIEEQRILWVGPIQGGIHLDLVSQCAAEMSKRPFSILALGSPTQVMEQYMYRTLVQMIVACKQNMRPSTPLHLFGGGHPSMLGLAVSLGCDLFDSASYAIFARKNRYLTPNGTIRLEELQYLPCSCEVCRSLTAKDLINSPPPERMRKLAIHNLNACLEEIRRVKESIIEGRLWELVMQRARVHPRLFESIHEFGKYRNLFERHSPLSKKRGLFFFDHLDLDKPEVFRFRKRVASIYYSLEGSKTLVLLPLPPTKPYVEDRNLKNLLKSIDRSEDFRVCFYGIPLGAIPLELGDVYPVAQTEADNEPNSIVVRDTAEALAQYLKGSRCRKIILHVSNESWHREIEFRIKKVCRETHRNLVISRCGDDVWGGEAFARLSSHLTASRKGRKHACIK